MRVEAQQTGDVDHMVAWAGQSARLARPEPAGEIVARLWREGRALLSASAQEPVGH
jgi:nitronate monooxygenase